MVGSLPSTEPIAEGVVGRVESIPDRSHTRDVVSVDPRSSSDQIRRDSARSSVAFITGASGMDQIHQGSTHGPSGSIQGASAGYTHPDPSYDSISPMDSISNTVSGQRDSSQIGSRSSADLIHRHVSPVERTVSADQSHQESIHSVRDPAENLHPSVAGPSSVPRIHSVRDPVENVRPSVAGPPSVPRIHSVRDPVENVRPSVAGPSSVPRIHSVRDPVENVRPSVAGPPSVPRIHSVRDPVENVRPSVAGPISVPQNMVDSAASTSQVEEEPSLLSIASESGVSSHVSAFSIESTDNFETGSEYSGADH